MLRKIFTRFTKAFPITGSRCLGLVKRHVQRDAIRAFPLETDPGKLEDLTPDALTAEQRIQLAARCRDMDHIPRRSRAGQVQVLPDQTRVQIMHNGIRVLADGYCGEWMTQLIARCRGCHEPQEERVFHEIMTRLPSEGTMLELGGYWAFYSLWFLLGGKNRRAVIVEPDPKHLTVGRMNARLNGRTPIFVHAFVGSTPSPPMRFKTAESGEILVPRVSVSHLMELHAIERLDVLHCDIQGAEFEVLSNCADLFERRLIKFVFISTHHFRISGDPLTHQRCVTVIRNCGGQIIAEHDVHESYSGDGLIVAYFGDESGVGAPVSISYNRYSDSLFRNPLYDLAIARAREYGSARGDQSVGG
jgi:FkbM family methyltransferase